MYDTDNSEALFFSSERNDGNRRRFAKEDWGCFLFAICEHIGVKFNRFSPHSMQQLLVEGFSRNLRRKLKKDIVSAIFSAQILELFTKVSVN